MNQGIIKLHLDPYIQELCVIAEYQLIRTKILKPKKVPMATGLVWETSASDCPETPNPLIQKHYRSIVAKILFAAHWIRYFVYCCTVGTVQCVSRTIPLGSVDTPHWLPSTLAQLQADVPGGFRRRTRWQYRLRLALIMSLIGETAFHVLAFRRPSHCLLQLCSGAVEFKDAESLT